MLPPAAAPRPTTTHAEVQKKMKSVSIFSVSIFFRLLTIFFFTSPVDTPTLAVCRLTPFFVHTPAVDLSLLTPAVDVPLELRMIQP
jgi:hypothetical protein